MDRNQLLNDTETALRVALDGRQAALWTALPAIVQKVNLAAMTLEAQPTIQGVVTDSNGKTKYVNLPVLLDVPICFPRAGGFILTLPIKAGDEVLVVFSSRCIDAWWQNGGIGIPIEMRMHDLSDGFAIPGPSSKPKVVPNISSTKAQLRNDAGTVYVEITPGGAINLVAPGGMTFTGNLNVTGAIVATGEVTGNGKALSTHVHSGVTPGGGTSGPPV